MKPEVPQGPIRFEESQQRVSAHGLRRQLTGLVDSGHLDQVEAAIADEDWTTAAGLLFILGEQAGQANNAAVRLARRINRRIHSPLLSEVSHD